VRIVPISIKPPAGSIETLDQASALKRIRELEPEAIYLSATQGSGLKGLRTWLKQTFWEPEDAPPNG